MVIVHFISREGNMGICMMMTQRVAMRQSLRQSFGETIGDIPMYSLHRIRNLFHKGRGPRIGEDLAQLLTTMLLNANQQYKDDSGNDWSCLTSNNLVDAIESLDEELETAIESMRVGQPRECLRGAKQLIEQAHGARSSMLEAIRIWFADNTENISYDMNGKVPWFVVRSLRKSLSSWALKNENPFSEDIGDAIISIAKDNGIETNDPETAWEKMGGTIFK